VGRVTVSVVDVVDVISMRSGLVATARTVLVGMVIVDSVSLDAALVPVALVGGVRVPVVEVVDVVAMLDGSVAAVRPMLVGMVLMNLVLGCHGHTVPYDCVNAQSCI
jgi:hypothetical protein